MRKCVAIVMLAVSVRAGGDEFTIQSAITANGVQPDTCYVFLKPMFPDLEDHDSSVCKAIINNLNKFCDSSPQYDRRLIHPTTHDLSEPSWSAIDAKSNMELVKQTYLASTLPQYRDREWEYASSYMFEATTANTLRFWRADLGGDLRGALQTVYMLENTSPHGQPSSTNQPRVMFMDDQGENPSPLFNPLGNWGTDDIFRFQSAWYLIGFQREDKVFEVKQLSRPRAGGDAPVAASTKCRIGHVNDLNKLKRPD